MSDALSATRRSSLFSQRRVYQLQEVVVAAEPQQLDVLKAAANKARNAWCFKECSWSS